MNWLCFNFNRLLQVPESECLALDDGDEPLGHNLHDPVHVFSSRCGWIRSCGLFNPLPGGCVGHLPVLSLRRRGTELYFPHNQPLWRLDQHHHHHYPQVCEHSCVFNLERESVVHSAMGRCGYGVCGSLLPNLVQVREEGGSACCRFSRSCPIFGEPQISRKFKQAEMKLTTFFSNQHLTLQDLKTSKICYWSLWRQGLFDEIWAQN